MMIWMRRGASVAAIMVVATGLTACLSDSQRFATTSAPEQLAPVQNSTVASTTLPPIGANGAVVTAQAGAVSQPLPGQVDPNLTGTPVLGAGNAEQTLQTATTDGSFVTLDSVGTTPNATGRDLSGGLTIERLLGGWTVVSGATECRLNLTYTAKTGTSRYRASAPGCELPGLAAVASWQLAGSQVQLFDERGSIIAALILSGNRFIGTLAGGQGISMVG